MHVQKRGHDICIFYYPLSPLQTTKILEPFDNGDSTLMPLQMLQNEAKHIFSHLNHMGMGMDMMLDEFLLSLHMDEQMYIQALRSQLTKPQVFLQRSPKSSPKSIRTNAFGNMPHNCRMQIQTYNTYWIHMLPLHIAHLT